MKKEEKENVWKNEERGQPTSSSDMGVRANRPTLKKAARKAVVVAGWVGQEVNRMGT